jgi:hypothetical protein
MPPLPPPPKSRYNSGKILRIRNFQQIFELLLFSKARILVQLGQLKLETLNTVYYYFNKYTVLYEKQWCSQG